MKYIYNIFSLEVLLKKFDYVSLFLLNLSVKCNLSNLVFNSN